MNTKNIDVEKLELYRLLGQGFKAMQEGRVSSLEVNRERKKNSRLLRNLEVKRYRL